MASNGRPVVRSDDVTLRGEVGGEARRRAVYRDVVAVHGDHLHPPGALLVLHQKIGLGALAQVQTPKSQRQDLLARPDRDRPDLDIGSVVDLDLAVAGPVAGHGQVRDAIAAVEASDVAQAVCGPLHTRRREGRVHASASATTTTSRDEDRHQHGDQSDQQHPFAHVHHLFQEFVHHVAAYVLQRHQTSIYSAICQ